MTGTLKDGVFKLTLAGTGASKGAKLTVIITGTTMTGMTGSLLGQKINLTQM